MNAAVGADVVDPEVTEVERAVGRDRHAVGFLQTCHHLPLTDLMNVPVASFVERPGDEGAVWGNQVGARQEGAAPKGAVHKLCIFFTPHTCTQRNKSSQL